MEKKTTPLLVGASYVSKDLGVSRAKAYEIIKELNQALKASYPNAIIIHGRVNRNWYYEASRITTK